MTASNILKSVLKQFAKTPEWVMPVIVDWVVGTIKNPDSKSAQAMKPALLELAADINQKFGVK